jgi:tRNA(Arg) A34 adenosine deaminase TadA
MNNNNLMLLAITEAKKSKENIGCGVVISKNEVVISKAYNSQRETNDATAHAEINAIRLAGKNLKCKNLNDCVAYCTCEPCIMCLSAIIFAKISKIYFGTTLKETFPNNIPIYITTKKFLEHSTHNIDVVGGLMKSECLVLLKKT